MATRRQDFYMLSCDYLESENFQVLTQDCNSIWNVAEETPKSLCVLSEHSYLFILIIFLFPGSAMWHVGSVVSPPSVEPSPPAFEAQNLNHWTAGKSP